MKEDKYEALRAKAEVLIEALPYIQRFNRRIIVVKYGTWWRERDQQMGGKSRNGTGVCKRSEKNRC